jgi:hypothetical protein
MENHGVTAHGLQLPRGSGMAAGFANQLVIQHRNLVGTDDQRGRFMPGNPAGLAFRQAQRRSGRRLVLQCVLVNIRRNGYAIESDTGKQCLAI